jgi:hypothetical protein
MSLFSAKDENINKTKHIRPIVLKTENVAKELANIASSNRVDIASLDFNLLSIQTFIRSTAASKNELFTEIGFEELAQLSKSTKLLDPNFEIKQSYEIEVFTKKPKPAYDTLHFSIGVNATMCKVFLSFKKGAFASLISTFEEDMTEMINKKKIRANLLVGIFDEMMHVVISDLNSIMIVNNSLSFSDNQSFLIAGSIEPEPTVNDNLIMHFRDKNAKIEKNQVDYSRRNFVISVVKDELLIEYIKPKKGTSGRNCRGEFLTSKEPKAENAPVFKVTNKIEVRDSIKSVEYRAAESGYIVYENETYDICDELDLAEVSFKSTGSIETKLEAEVSLKVKESDVLKEAVGMGMDVEVSAIEVEGNVGAKAKVHANKAIINGQTHKSSYVSANDLTINIHKGVAHGNNVHITRLEQGEVMANTLQIGQAIGGHIRSKEVSIDLIGSHVVVQASQLIEIKKMQGSENKFIIDPLAVDTIDEDVGKMEKDLSAIDEQIRLLKRDIEKYNTLIKNNEGSYIEVKKKLIHYKNNGIAMPDAFVKAFKQFHKYKENLEQANFNLTEKKSERERLNISILTIQNNIFSARIINRDKWVGYNEIRFKLIDPPMDIVFAPHEGSPDKVFALIKTENDEYKIKAVKE